MTGITADPKQTHALVVGIERYEIEGSDLDGPALDAREFRDYLVDEVGVPTAQIHLLLSPIEKNRRALDISERKAKEATRQRVRDAVRELRGRGGELLVVYWAGHGIINLEGQRLLFYADARDDDRQNLDLNSLLDSLSTSSFPDFRRQLVFVDACATYEEWSREYSDPEETFPKGDRWLGTPQFVLYAARLGQPAGNLAGRGLFSGKLLPRLKEQRLHWPPDVEHIADELCREFEDDDVAQMPAYYFKNWDGDEREKNPVGDEHCLIERERAEKLLDCACNLGIEPATLRRIYRDCAPRSLMFAWESKGAELRADTLLRSLILRLRTAAMTRGGSHPLLRLAMHLEREAVDDAVLIDWIHEAATALGISQEAVERQRQKTIQDAAGLTEAQSVLLVIVAPPRSTTGVPTPATDSFDVRAGLLMEPGTATDWQELEIRWLNPKGERYGLEELKSQIHLWAVECPDEPRIEVFLPEHLLDDGVDQWRRHSLRVRRSPALGRTHRVVVRSWDRTYDLTNPDYSFILASWRRNWERLDKCQRQCADLPAHVFQPEDFGVDGEAFKNKVGAGCACVAIERKPVVDPPVEAHVWLSGTPIALWRRGEPGDREDATRWRQWLDGLMEVKAAREWADRTHEARRGDGKGYGTEITLLYDNPCKLPLDAPASRRLRQPTRFS